MSVAELPNQEVTIYDADLIEEKHYWLPFPTKSVTLYSTFYQNPGW